MRLIQPVILINHNNNNNHLAIAELLVAAANERLGLQVTLLVRW